MNDQDWEKHRSPDMSPEVWRIHKLIGMLSEAFWHSNEKRASEPGFSRIQNVYEHYEGECRPETEEEAAIWAELTSPDNYDALVSWVNYRPIVEVNDYAARLRAALLAETQRRRQRDAASDQSRR